MKTALTLFAIALGACIPLSGANAAEKSPSLSLDALSQSEDFSARKRHRQRVHVHPGYYGHHYAYYPQRFGPADPAWQSPELRRLRALNRCVIDLGYGRWENCN